ncbi:MAG: hypothetical protein Fur0010_00260 [Bdellovibrio sp.]
MNNLFSPDANPEQNAAILAPGGVLLNAGAGSGKTFVIVGHLIQKIYDSLSPFKVNKEELDQRASLFLERIVVMTFTKKAAGELTLRIHKKLDELIKNGPDKDFWSTIKLNVQKIYVGTIHGFCYRLIKTGLIPSVNSEASIIDQFTLENRLTQIIDDYLEIKSKINDAHPSLFRHRDSIVSALSKIFSEPDLRLSWRELDLSKGKEQVLQDYLNLLMGVSTFHILWEEDIQRWIVDDSSKPAAWHEIVKSVYQVVNHSEFSIDGMEKLFEVLKNFKQLRAPKNHEEEFFEFFNRIKEFKNFAKENLEDIQTFFDDFENYINWMKELKLLFDHCEERYKNLGLLTFGDMELLVHSGLKSKSIRDQISKRFDYIIVDEFQDTSWLQYQVLQFVVMNNLDKVFCVGDMKQAIYGFRGGEVGVFKDLQEKIQRPLKLKANYRSKSTIVSFNNDLFRNVLPLGIGFEGHDQHSVEVVDQDFSQIEPGEIVKLKTVINNQGESLTSGDMDFYEAKALSKFLESEREKKIKTCILYRKLTPSHYLITELMRKDIGFKCQVKVPFGEDPIVIIFHTLVEYLIMMKDTKVDSQKYLAFLLENIFRILNLEIQNSSIAIEEFNQQVKLYGLKIAFDLFLNKLGIVVTDIKDSQKYIDSLCQSYSDDWEAIWVELKKKLDTNYNYEFTFGQNPEFILMMTAHASKGLQFPRIILAGIHTNGREKPNREAIGKWPMSSKWIPNKLGKKLKRSPFMTLEMEADKLKSFSESKRLFYVACTRAEHSLVWADLSKTDGELKHSDNSWIVGLRKCDNIIRNYITERHYSFDFVQHAEETLDQDEESGLKLPLFHLDNCGLIGFQDKISELSILSELSVTRLTSAIQCPRKFYLQNICKIDPDFQIKELMDENDEQKNHLIINENQIQYKESAAERGTRVHAMISRFIRGEENSEISLNDEKLLKWIDEVLSPYRNSQLLSEKIVKFSINGFMISGTPDLLIVDEKTQLAEVWDFKTGRRNEDKEDHYWAQVVLYAFYLAETYKFQKVKVKLIYVDEFQIAEKELGFKQIVEKVNQLWKLTTQSHLINRSHCSSCSFGNLCRER